MGYRLGLLMMMGHILIVSDAVLMMLLVPSAVV